MKTMKVLLMNTKSLSDRDLKKIRENEKVTSVNYKGDVIDIEINDPELVKKILKEQFDINIR